MRRLLKGGIKAILAIAALSTAAHWALRVQREPAPEARALAAVPDPVTTGSISPRPAPEAGATAKDVTSGLDQRHLSELIAGSAPDKPKPKRTEAAKR